MKQNHQLQRLKTPENMHLEVLRCLPKAHSAKSIRNIILIPVAVLKFVKTSKRLPRPLSMKICSWFKDVPRFPIGSYRPRFGELAMWFFGACTGAGAGHLNAGSSHHRLCRSCLRRGHLNAGTSGSIGDGRARGRRPSGGGDAWGAALAA